MAAPRRSQQDRASRGSTFADVANGPLQRLANRVASPLTDREHLAHALRIADQLVAFRPATLYTLASPVDTPAPWLAWLCDAKLGGTRGAWLRAWCASHKPG